MGFYGLPPIGQRRPMDGAQFHPLWVGEAGGRLNGVRKKWGERTKRPKSIPCISELAAVSVKLLQWGSRGIGSPAGGRLPASLWSLDRL